MTRNICRTKQFSVFIVRYTNSHSNMHDPLETLPSSDKANTEDIK